MSEQIDVQAVIEQLMSRIAQLELEVAVLKAMKSDGMELIASTEPMDEEAEKNSGYM